MPASSPAPLTVSRTGLQGTYALYQEAGNKAAVDAVWKEYKNGTITLDESRTRHKAADELESAFTAAFCERVRCARG